MHRQLISGHLAWPTPRDGRIRPLGGPPARPVGRASVPKATRVANSAVTQEIPELILPWSKNKSRRRSAMRYLLGMSDDGVRSRMTHGHVRMRRPTARETASKDTAAMAGRMARFARPARMVMETA